MEHLDVVVIVNLNYYSLHDRFAISNESHALYIHIAMTAFDKASCVVNIIPLQLCVFVAGAGYRLE